MRRIYACLSETRAPAIEKWKLTALLPKLFDSPLLRTDFNYEEIEKMQVTVLTPSQQATFDSFRARLNDVIYFDRLLAEPVRKSIIDIETGMVVLNSTTTKAFTNKYISARKLPTKEEKALSVEINHIMCTLCVYMIRRSRPPVDIYTPAKIAELKEILEGLADYDDIECNLLLTFRDVVETAVKLFPNKDNKARVLFIGHRLGGSNLNMGKYSTGGGQSRPTERRVRIYEHESGTTPHRPSQETFAPRMVPSVIVPKSPPRVNLHQLNASLGKRGREGREVIEIHAPGSDAPEDLLRQFQSLKQLAADYTEKLNRFAKQKVSSTSTNSTTNPSYRIIPAHGKSPRPGVASSANGSTSANANASVPSNTALAGSFLSQYRSNMTGSNLSGLSSLNGVHVAVVTPEASEMLSSEADKLAQETHDAQDDHLVFPAHHSYVPVVSLDYTQNPDSAETTAAKGSLDVLLSAFDFLQNQQESVKSGAKK